jgi:dihydroxyacetone kinase
MSRLTVLTIEVVTTAFLLSHLLMNLSPPSSKCTIDKERSFVPFKNDVTDCVVLLANNLGGLSELELGGVVAEVRRALGESGIQIMCLLSGSFVVRSVHNLRVSVWIDDNPI